MSHPDEGTIQALLDGELEEGERRRTEAHLTACPACAARLAEARDYLREADRLVGQLEVPSAPGVAPIRRKGRGAARALAWAASIALAVALGYWGRGVPAVPPAAIGTEAPGARADEAVASAVTPTPTEPARAAAPAQRAKPEAKELPAPGAAAAAPAPAPAPPAEKALAASEDAAAPVTLAWRVVAMEEAVAELGGQIRLIDGMTPDRVELGPGTAVAGADAFLPVVRVSYARGSVVLDQQRPRRELARMEGAPLQAAKSAAPAAGALGMTAPSLGWSERDGIRFVVTGSVSADSLAALAGRVR